MKYLRDADDHLIAYLRSVQPQQFPFVFIPGATTNNCKKDAPMKVLQAYSGEETQTVWVETIKRLLHRYLEHRKKRRMFRRACAENGIVVSYEGRRWCDATERELIGDIKNGHRSHF
jgi:hypothetical protein